ncbi:hypothetical protein GUJ93_ZPchr0013g33816 [Zizania palustris]|uniref:non-specific serine/threonine protein kinase n=1 Tax=Zizania palustris TaxID=103762 RepID=A0A8J6BXY0_ZIZPA|nr:hypothetical protein GUJ93_ZPchr0013g33816 [Zizania palustris]
MRSMLLAALLLLLLSSSLMLLAGAQPFCSNANTLYMEGDTYRSDLLGLAKALIANVSATENSGKKSHSAIGATGAGTTTGPDKVYGAAICRGDSAGKDCASRLQQALDKAVAIAIGNGNNGGGGGGNGSRSSSKNVTLYDDDYQAQLSFSDQDIISSSFDVSPACTVRAYLNPPPNSVDSDLFTKFFSELMEKLAGDAMAQPERYSTGQGYFDPKGRTVYGLAQCMESMSPESCGNCLGNLAAEGKKMTTSGLTGGAILGARCSMWYETDIHFFKGDPRVSLHTPTPSKFWIWVTIGSFSLTSSISWLLVHIWIKTERKREQARYELRLLSMAIQNVINLWRIEEGNSGFSLYDFSQIKEATHNFSAENKLGQGGFGPVYKGILPGGLEVAVKRLAACSVQGLLEFKNEIQLIAKLQHKNLVKLLGCCIEGDQEKMLVYEYLQNKSLDIYIFGTPLTILLLLLLLVVLRIYDSSKSSSHPVVVSSSSAITTSFVFLHADCVRGAELNWAKRLRIIDGIAQGILYLHNHSRLCVVHRDLKASNILLDSDMTPKISDFGMARIFCSNMIESNTTRIVGTQ